MRVIYKRILLVITLYLAVMQSFTHAGTNFEQWSNMDGTFHLNEDWVFTVENQSRFREGMGCSYYHADFGFLYTHLADWIDVGFNYRYITNKIVGQEWSDQHRPHLNLIFKGDLFDLPFKNRMRFEFNADDNFGDFGTFRNKITINPGFSDKRDYLFSNRKKRLNFFRSHNMRPFASHELFVDTHTDEISRHRFSAGLSMKLNDKFLSDIYYLYELNSSFGPKEDIRVLGLSMKIVF